MTDRATFLDRVISAISPARGLQRRMAREALHAIDDHYQAAQADRSFRSWLTTGADVNVAVADSVERVRDRCRDLGRNDPYISRAYDVLVAKMIGTGVRPRLPESVPAQTRARTIEAWKRWVDEADLDGLQDLYGLQAQAVRTMVESGMALVRFIPAPDARLRIPWKIQIQEPDFLDLTKNAVLERGGMIINGVEFDGMGRRVAYWLYPEHPGRGLTLGSGLQSQRIEAQFVAPVYRAQRPDQVIGMPWAAPVVTRAKHLDDLADARLKRAKIQACYAAFVTRDDGGVVSASTGQRRREQMAPGMIENLLPGEDVRLAVPPSSEGDEEWQRLILHSIACGMGVTYSQITGDLSQVNYSSMRAGSMDQWDLLDQWQNVILKPMLLNPIWRVFDGVEGSRQRRNSWLSVEWDFPERPLVDPLKDGQAIDAALMAGRRTFKDVVASSGKDPEVHIANLKRERAMLEDLGLPHLLPAMADRAPEAQPAANDDDREDEESEDEASE